MRLFYCQRSCVNQSFLSKEKDFTLKSVGTNIEPLVPLIIMYRKHYRYYLFLHFVNSALGMNRKTLNYLH